MSLLWTWVLSIGIPVAYLFIGAVSGAVAYQVAYSKSSETYEGCRRIDASMALWMTLFFWPLAWAPLLAILLRDHFEISPDGLTRRQRRTLAFEEQRHAIAKKANETQREWLRLIEKEGVR